ncbi:MAG: hypothetical protein COA88_07220 [Kordia sp.]|nr:MAG: hypothetical protein COA88_07220 [Kordia sp.]
MINKNILKNQYARRAIAFYFDSLIITFLALTYLFLFDREGPTIECDTLFCWNTSRIAIFQVLFYIIYFLFMEYFFQFTIGKRILGFSVAGEKNKMFFWKILMRTLIRLIPLNIFSFLVDNNRLFWHEKWTKIITQNKKKLNAS